MVPEPVVIDYGAVTGAAEQTLMTAVESGVQATDAVRDARELAVTAAAPVVDAAQAMSEVIPVYLSWWEPITEENTVETISHDFSIPRRLLVELNPGVDLDAMVPGDLLRIAHYDPADPPRSHGHPNRGRLINGLPMPDGPYWRVRHHNEAWGTWYTLANLVRGFTYVAERFPNTQVLLIGDISARRGRRMRPHLSHQSGRDADIEYYLIDTARAQDPEVLAALEAHPDRFVRASRDTLDFERQWALFSYWIDRGLVTYIFMDRRLQRYLYRWAIANGVDEEYLRHALQAAPGSDHPIIRHATGHSNHFHVRFTCNTETDVRCSE